MTDHGRQRRSEQRKYKRLSVRYGAKIPEHTAVATHISTRGLFLSVNDLVFTQGSPLVVEITGPSQSWVATGIVRHAVKVHPNVARFTRPGMGIEFLEMPPACRDFLAAL
jgi:hypothetical protein